MIKWRDTYELGFIGNNHQTELDSTEWRRRGEFVGGLNSPSHFATIWWRGCRQYGGSPHLIYSVNNTGSVNYIWVVAKQWAFYRGLSRLPRWNDAINFKKSGSIAFVFCMLIFNEYALICYF